MTGKSKLSNSSIKSVLYGEVVNIANQLDNLVQPDVLLSVQSSPLMYTF
jgi:hypothetical protein